MLKLIIALLPLAATVTAQQAAAKPTPTKATLSRTAAAKPTSIQGIPAGAVQIDEITYRFQEKDSSGKPGKIWLFRRNPFGVSKIEEKEAAKLGLVAPHQETPATASDLGDAIRFERPGPFGSKVWSKSKFDLTDEERAIAEKNKVPVTSTQKAAN